MPIRIRYQNNAEQECTIRPTPFVSTSTNILKNGAGEAFGVTYTLTLTGTLLPDEGMPFALDHLTNQRYQFFDDVTGTRLAHEVLIGPYKTFDNGTGGVSHFDGGRPQMLYFLSKKL